MQVAEITLCHRMSGVTLRDKVRRLDLGKELGQELSVLGVWAFYQEASIILIIWGILGMSN